MEVDDDDDDDDDDDGCSSDGAEATGGGAAAGEEEDDGDGGDGDGGDGDGELRRLRRRLDRLELSLKTRRAERRELRRAHGGVSALKEALAAQGGRAAQLALLNELQRKEATVTATLRKLNEGIETNKSRVAAANAHAFATIRAQVAASFGALVPSKVVDLHCEDPEHLDAAAVEFRLRDRPASGDRGGGGAWRAGVDELSGGQRTLLNLSVYLAAAKYRPSLVLLMDEVDAALDEHNTQRVAAMLKEVARTSQVVAISHHTEFHELADHMVHLSKASDHTVVR